MRLARAAVGHAHREARFAVLVAHVGEAHVGLRAAAIGDDAAVAHLADHLLHHRMVDAHHGEAVEGNVLDEGEEGLLGLVEGAVMVEVLGIDVGDDHDVGGKLDEGAVGFIRLHHHPVALAEARIGAIGVDDAAVDDGGIEVAGIEQCGDQRGGRGLAVRAAHGHAGLEAHQLGQHLGAAHDGQVAVARFDQFRIVVLHRGGDDDDLRIAEVLRLVADMHVDAALAQAGDVVVVGEVGALHLVAQRRHHLGDAAHADAADADEMDGADVAREFHGLFPCEFLGEIGKTLGRIGFPVPQRRRRRLLKLALLRAE